MSIASALTDIKNAITSSNPAAGPAAYKKPVVWNSGAAYGAGPPADLVTITGASGGLFVAVGTSTNVDPTTDNGTYWMQVASNGAAGPAGSNGLGYNPRGPWAATTAYAVYDTVLTGTAPNQQLYICIAAHTSAGSFVQGSNWITGTAPGASGLSVMVWNGSAYVKASDSTTGRPSSGSFPGGTVLWIGPSNPQASDGPVNNDPFLNYSAA